MNRKEYTIMNKKSTFSGHLIQAVLPLFLALFLICLVPPAGAWAKTGCQPACAAALKATGNISKIKYKSITPMDFGGFSASAQKKAVSFIYICDGKEVYSICVAKAGNTADAKSLLKTLKTYKTNNCSSTYLSDYSATEQKVFRNAVCGRKGNYVWYIAMSPRKSANTKGQKALKSKL